MTSQTKNAMSQQKGGTMVDDWLWGSYTDTMRTGKYLNTNSAPIYFTY